MAELIGLIGLLCLLCMVILRIPVAIAMIIVGIGGNFILSLYIPYIKFVPYIKQLKHSMWGTLSNYDLSVIPLFILMGFLASHAHISRDLFNGFQAIMGRFRGGVAMATIGSCASFGAICGSSIATTTTMGHVVLPELKRLGYAPSLAAGTLAIGGTLGILIPPSIGLIIYAVIVEASIITMFQAAFIPAILAVIIFIITIAIQMRLTPNLAPKPTPISGKKYWQAIIKLLPIIIIFGLIMTGLLFGVFTPTPAAAIGASIIMLYGIIVQCFNKEAGLNWSRIKQALLDSATTTVMVYFIIIGADILKGFIVRANLPDMMATMMVDSMLTPWLILLYIIIALIVLGCIMDSLSIILVVIPFIWPALIILNGGDYVSAEHAAFGMNTDDLKIWFGIIALIIIELGLITPPIGLNILIIHALSQYTIAISTIIKGVAPFLMGEAIRIILLITLPSLSLFLPHYLT